MHLDMMLATLTFCYILRQFWPGPRGNRSQRWYTALSLFALPPLLLLTTTIAILCMGVQGSMWGLPVGWIGYLSALSCLIYSLSILIFLVWKSWVTLRLVRTYPTLDVIGRSGYLVNSTGLFAGQVGLWQPRLIISQGLLDQLSEAQLDAVLTHEQAHEYYSDTIWFFGLGWLRQISSWLPKTEALWQELLLLRECRADAWAAQQQIEPLLLAETLLFVVTHSSHPPEISCVAFGSDTHANSLEERIEALISPDIGVDHSQERFTAWFWVLLTCLPLLTIPFHVF